MGVKIQISLYISPSSGLFFISPDEDLLFEVETSRVNFLVSFNSDDQRNTDVTTTADVTTYLKHRTNSICSRVEHHVNHITAHFANSVPLKSIL